MTTFLLHGGATSKDLEGNNLFFGQFAELVNKSKIKVLMCYFSRPKENWQKLFDRDSVKVTNNTTKQVEFHIPEDAEDLKEKLPSFDVLYVAGGEAELIEPYYQELAFLKTDLEGKVYAGSSMGAFMASEGYVLSADAQESGSMHKGLGLLPIQTLCHWDVEDKKEVKLKLLSSDKPILALNEGEFVTMFR